MSLRSIAALAIDASTDAHLLALNTGGRDQLVDIPEDHAFQKLLPQHTRFDSGTLSTTYTELARHLLCCVHNPHGSTPDFHWGLHAYHPDFLLTCLDKISDAMVASGLDLTPHPSYASFHSTIAEHREQAVRVTVTNEDFFAIEPSPQVSALRTAPVTLLEDMPLHAPSEALHGFCDALGDLEEYLPGHLLWEHRRKDSDIAFVASHLLTHISWLDPTVYALPPSRSGQRVLSILQRTLWPAALRIQLSSEEKRYEDIEVRMVLAFDIGIQPSRFKAMLATRAHRLLDSNTFPNITDFLNGYTSSDAWKLMHCTATLYPSSLLSEAPLDLDSLASAAKLNDALGQTKNSWLQPDVVKLAPLARVQWLEALLGKARKLKDKKAPLATHSVTPAKENQVAQVTLDDSDETLQAQFGKVGALKLEAEILALFEAKTDDYVFDIFDLIADSNEDIYKKAALGLIRNTGYRQVFKKIATILPYWEQWANLRLVSDGTEEVTALMRTFTPEDGFWDNLRHLRYDKVCFIRDVWSRYHTIVLKAKKPLVLPDNPMLDTALRARDKTFGDRAFAALGFKSVERNGVVPDSYAALSDKVGKFFEQGAPLAGTRKHRKHSKYALQFHLGIMMEAAREMRVWARSTDATHPFPSRFIPQMSPARELLERREAQLTKHLSFIDYNSSTSAESDPDVHHRRKESSKRSRDKRTKTPYCTSDSEDAQPSPSTSRRTRSPSSSRKNRKGKGDKGKGNGGKGDRAKGDKGKGAKGKGGRDKGNGKGSLPEPEDVDIGASNTRVNIVETDTSISLNGVPQSKADLAEALAVGTDDLCWAPLLSSMPYPLCLRICNHVGEPGHETHLASKHAFNQEHQNKIAVLVGN